MSCELLLGSSFRVLEDCLLEKLTQLCKSEPFSPKWVVVPTSTLAGHLRLRLTRECRRGVLADVRVAPVSVLLDRLAELVGRSAGPRWSPLLDLHLFELLRGWPGDAALAGLSRVRGGHRFLIPTFLDFADGGFGFSQIELLREIADEPDLSQLERETILAYIQWLGLVQRRDLCWSPLSHQHLPEVICSAEEAALLSVLGAETSQSVHVLCYGFYDFIDTLVQILQALAARLRLTLFVPYAQWNGRPHPGFSFVDEVIEDLRLRIGSCLTEERRAAVVGREGAASLFLSTFPEGDIPEQPSWLSFQRASGVRAELISAALRVRQWLDNPNEPLLPEEILVLAPDPAPYLTAIQDLFPAFGIPFRLAQAPAGPTAAERRLRLLLKVWEEDAPSEWLLAYLRESRGLRCLQDVDLDGFEDRIRKVRLSGGPGWSRLAAIMDSTPLGFTPAEQMLVREISDLWAFDGQARPEAMTARRFLEIIGRIQERWVEERSLLDPVADALRSLPSDETLPTSAVLDALSCGLGQGTVSDPIDQPGVLFLPLMRARGLTARGLVLLGLATGQMPSRIEEDPLLSDAARLRLARKAGDVGYRLAVKSRSAEEMTLLFLLLNTSAERVHWVIPECDESGRAVAPNPWVQRYVHAWDGGRADGDLVRIPRGPADQARLLYLRDAREGRFLPPRLAVFFLPELTAECDDRAPYGHILQGARMRLVRADWSGCVEPASFASTAAGRRALDVTELASLAKCAFRFYCGSVAGWKGLRPLEFSTEPDALERGGLLHRIMEAAVGAVLRSDRVPPKAVATALLEDGGALLRKAVETTLASSYAFALLPSLLQGALRSDLTKAVRAYWEACLRGRIDGLILEREIRLAAQLPRLPTVEVVGRIDRLDERGGCLHILDYKSGRKPNKGELEKEVRLGYRLQPVLYPWLLQAREGKSTEVSFSFVFLGSITEEPEMACQAVDPAELLDRFAQILATGLFLPSSTEALEGAGVEDVAPCRYCEFASVCRRFDRNAAGAALKWLRESPGSGLEFIFRQSH